MVKRKALSSNTSLVKRRTRSTVPVAEIPEIIVIDSSSEDEDDVDKSESEDVDTSESGNVDSSNSDNVDTSRSDPDPSNYRMHISEDVYYDIQVEKRVSSDEKVLKRFKRMLDEFNRALKDRVPDHSASAPYDVDKYPVKKFGGVVGMYIQFLAFNGVSEFDTGADTLKEYLDDLVSGRNYYSQIMPDLENHYVVLVSAFITVFNSKIKYLTGDERYAYYKAHDKGKLDYLHFVYIYSEGLDKMTSKKPDDIVVSEQTSFLRNQSPIIIVKNYKSTGSSNKRVRETAFNCIFDLLLSSRSSLRGESKRSLKLMDLSYNEKYNSSRGPLPLLSLKIQKDYGECCDDLPKFAAVTRHKNPLVCLVTAVAFFMWYNFDMRQGQLSGSTRPNVFDPDEFNNIKLLSSPKIHGRSPLNLLNHNDITLHNLEIGGFTSAYHKTHPERTFDTDRISLENIKINGICDSPGTQEEVIPGFSLSFIMNAAGFERKESYRVSRDIKPPEWLERQIFPWIEDMIKRHEEIQKKAGIIIESSASNNFLQMLVSLRPVILQDLAVMGDLISDSIFTRHWILNSPAFQKFKEEVNNTLEPGEKLAIRKIATEKSASKKSTTGKQTKGRQAARETTSNAVDQHVTKQLVPVRSEATNSSQSSERRLTRMAMKAKLAFENTKGSKSRRDDTKLISRNHLLESLDRFSSKNSKFKSLETKIENLENKITKMEAKINKIDRIDKMESKLDVILGELRSSK